MLHELLMALMGIPGSIFTENGEDIQVVPDLPFIHIGEQSILNRLCKLGSYYKSLQAVIEENNYISHDAAGKQMNYGIYMQAFCQGLDSVLQSYSQDIVLLEKEILDDPYLPLTHLQYKLENYHVLLPAMKDLVKELRNKQSHGCNILEVVHKHSYVGNPIIKEAMAKIQQACCAVMYRQMTSWMLYAALVDPYKEFFIQPLPPPVEEASVNDVSRASSYLQPASQSRANQMHSLKTCRVVHELVPSFLAGPTADSVLFVGEVVRMFQDESKYTSLRDSPLAQKASYFAKQLYEFQEKEFRLSELEALIDDIRCCAAERLWKLLMEESKLCEHLQIIKDFFLLARGELFQAFIDQANHLLNVTPSANTECDVNVALQLAAQALLYEDDPALARFHVIVPTTPLQASSTFSSSTVVPTQSRLVFSSTNQSRLLASEVESENMIGWNVIGLRYDVEWPLHILFTSHALDRYSQIFQFLLSVKRAQLDLNQGWALQMQGAHVGDSLSSVWQLRNHMAFVVDNLQYYLQVDVLECQYSALLHKIKNTKDFEAIPQALESFQASILAQCFLLHRPISKCLKSLLNLCHTFRGLIGHGDPSTSQQEEVTNLRSQFIRYVMLLFTLLSGAKGQQVGPHLTQLLLRLDYNKYFTKPGGLFESL